MDRVLKVPPLNLDLVQNESELIKTIDLWFTDLYQQRKFNGIVLIRRQGIAKLSKGYGFSDHHKQNKLKPTSSLRTASLSKQFTAAGIMLLRDQNKLGYDDLIGKYISAIPYKDVTIRNLLNHTSGIPDIYLEFAREYRKEVLSTAKAIQLLISENRKPDSSPNQRFSYSNTNYIILARIVEIITEQSFEDFMEANVFAPMNMDNTRVYNVLSQEIDSYEIAEDLEFVNEDFVKVEPDFLDGVAGDGGIFTSLKDLEIWDDFWHGKYLLDQEKLQEAFKENELNDGAISKYGFGWMITENGMWHNGGWLGARSMFIRNTAKESCLAVIDNSSNIYFDKILNELEKIDQSSSW